METGGGDRRWSPEMETGGGDRRWSPEMETGGGDGRLNPEIETLGGDERWRHNVETRGGDDRWRREVETESGARRRGNGGTALCSCSEREEVTGDDFTERRNDPIITEAGVEEELWTSLDTRPNLAPPSTFEVGKFAVPLPCWDSAHSSTREVSKLSIVEYA
ncbi:hypothetical protein EYF80_019597 [Liparis tanakae]|uniref:Uncharacterized protein n=1 Tax=Liparis tanakae TaxID=230148 RepID=A0A4Z2HWJ6_9TELE|nr:hypothetical protein EYF80_019597 [Liparis tanakae]